jgi:hypothetical protein
MKGWQKGIWMLVIGAFLITEIRAINRDRAVTDAQASIDRQNQETAFGGIRDAQEKNFQATAKGLTDAYAQSQREFDATMNRFAQINSQEQQRFSSLVDQDAKLFEHEDQLAESLNGTLVPGDEPTPPNICGNIPDGSVLLFLGGEARGNVEVVSIFPSVVMAYAPGLPQGSIAFGASPNTPHFAAVSLVRLSDNRIAVLLDIRSDDGRIVVRMDRNGYVVNRNNILEIKKNPSKNPNRLTVFDTFGQVVLEVHYLNPRTIAISGPAINNSSVMGGCFEYSGPLIRSLPRPMPQ